MTEIARTVPSSLMSQRQREVSIDLTRQITLRSREVSTGMLAEPWRDMGPRGADAVAIRNQIGRAEGFVAQNRILDGRLEQVESVLSAVRGAAQEVMDIAVFSSESPQATARTLGTIARGAIGTIVNTTALRYDGTHPLSGTRGDQVPLRGFGEVSGQSGLSPDAVLADITGGAIGDLADATAKIDELRAAFSDTSATPGRNFEATFYNGAPARQADGTASATQRFRLSETETLDQPVRANDQAMRDVLRGLAMLSAVDVSAIDDPDAYAAWMKEATTTLSSGLTGIAQQEVETGLRRARVEDVIVSQEARLSFLERERYEVEGVDQYDAATRLTLLQSQLETNYAVTARLSRLSFLNFL